MKNSVIFDLDGTLWDVTNSTLDSANIITKKYNLKGISKKTVCSGFGLNREESSKVYFPDLEPEKSLKLMDEISKINIENLKKKGGKTSPSLKKVLDELIEKYDLYIVSNTSKLEYIQAFLNTSDTAKYFKEYIAASKLKITKADAIQKVIKDNNIKKAVYVGDTKLDLEAANASRIEFVQAKYGFGQDLKTEFYINELNELPKVLEEVFK